MTQIGIIRHGRTAWNVERRAQGSSDIPLDENGMEEAQKLADRLGEEEWDLIFASPLKRARQTAECVSLKLGNLPIIFDDRLVEVNGGLIEGTTEAERLEKWGEGWRGLDLGIEKTDDVIQRGKEFLEDLLNEHPDKKILIVSHGLFIAHFLKQLVPQFEMKEALRNTSVSTLIKGEKGWSCEMYNCTKHL